MASQTIPFDDNPTVVAIDKDKNSNNAVRWAIEHLLITNPTLVLINVILKTKNSNNNGTHSDANGGGLTDDIFAHSRTYCARKGAIRNILSPSLILYIGRDHVYLTTTIANISHKITVQEEVLQGVDVHSTLLDYVNKHHVTNLVLGAPTRHPISRKFWIHDVPTMINKAAPDFCSVYVIAKGKTQSIRPAVRQATNSRLPSAGPPVRLNPMELDGSRAAHSLMGDRTSFESMRHVNDVSKGLRNLPGRNSLDSDTMEPALAPKHLDITQVQMDNTKFREAANHEAKSLSISEVERLKLEVKQTMDMYNTACKEAVSAQKRADELHVLKLDEASRLEQARLAEEAALQLAEIEKAKCRAAIEAAEKAQKIAERETQRRRCAEQKAKREAEEKNRALDVLSNNDIRYRKYTIEEIEAATSRFSRSMKIGEGGYGPVFKGKLDHTAVAIKVLRPDAAQGKKQFQQEVEVLSCMRHPNMVLLMGACPEYGCLVYEFMNNGSLEDRLFRKGNTPPIPWGIRFKLAADIATGLLFLHQAKPEPLVHRDLKPANILLDRHYTCKISDVGLARLVPPNVADSVTQYHMTSAAGTLCYIDPEYQQTGKLGTKSDIYSLGVMLLQIITARPPMGLMHHVERAIQKGTFADLLDPTVPDWPVEEALVFAKLALKCAELRRKDRPDLDKVVLPELNRLKEVGVEYG